MQAIATKMGNFIKFLHLLIKTLELIQKLYECKNSIRGNSSCDNV